MTDPQTPNQQAPNPQGQNAQQSVDGATLDQWLEGELSDAASEQLHARVKQDAEFAAHVSARRRFLQGLAASGQTYRDDLPATLPAHVHARVRLALASPVSRRSWWPAMAAAATLLVAIGTMMFWKQPSPVIAQAMPMAVLRAIDFAAPNEPAAPKTPGTCDIEGDMSPLQSDVVRMGDYLVLACDDTPTKAGARLVRIEDLPVVGWAAERGTVDVHGPEIGMTVLRNYVVFDVQRGRKREYLAVARSLYDPLYKRTERASCIMCHNRSREGQPNPHNIHRRQWAD